VDRNCAVTSEGWRPRSRELDTERANSAHFARSTSVVSQNATLLVAFSCNDALLFALVAVFPRRNTS
jgi:hypothetical protein